MMDRDREKRDQYRDNENHQTNYEKRDRGDGARNDDTVSFDRPIPSERTKDKE